MPTTGSTGEINLTTRADKKVLERFKLKSVTQGLFSNAYSFTGVKTVQIPSIDVVPLNDYNAERVDGGSRYGNLINLGDTVQEFTMTQNKSFIFALDETYQTDQQQIKRAGECLRREVDEIVIPTVDKYRLQKIADACPADCIQTLAETAFNKTNIIETIFTANAAMSDQLVPVDGRVLYISYQDAVKMKLADQVVGIDKLGEKAIVNGAFGKIDATQVRLVPASYMPTGVKAMIVKTGIALAPTKIKKYAIHDGAHVLNGKIITGQLYHDCFVLAKGEKDAQGHQQVRGVILLKQS